MPGGNIESDADSQDSAEIFDEDNYNTDEQLNEMRTFEEMPGVLDVTTARGDRDDDEAVALDAGDFDPEAFDDEIDLEEDNELDYRASGEDEGGRRRPPWAGRRREPDRTRRRRGSLGRRAPGPPRHRARTDLPGL